MVYLRHNFFPVSGSQPSRNPRVVDSPPDSPGNQHAVGDDRAAGGVVAIGKSANFWFQSSSPVFMSSARTWLSIVTRKSLPL
jgi:hypothetical protein